MSSLPVTDDEKSSASLYFVRVGVMGQIGRFRPAEPLTLRRRDRVICRTARGLEIGEVLGETEYSTANADLASADLADGRVLRRMRPEDELLWGHLRQLGNETQEDCDAWLQQIGASTTLLQVEPMLDGKTLYFHFLSEVDDAVQGYLDTLVQLYEQRVRDSKFANLLENGCGPGCGTENAKNGCGSRGGCTVCKVASACKR